MVNYIFIDMESTKMLEIGESAVKVSDKGGLELLKVVAKQTNSKIVVLDIDANRKEFSKLIGIKVVAMVKSEDVSSFIENNLFEDGEPKSERIALVSFHDFSDLPKKIEYGFFEPTEDGIDWSGADEIVNFLNDVVDESPELDEKVMEPVIDNDFLRNIVDKKIVGFDTIEIKGKKKKITSILLDNGASIKIVYVDDMKNVKIPDSDYPVEFGFDFPTIVY